MSSEMTPLEIEEARAELLRCAQDEIYGLEKCITITDKSKSIHPIKLYNSQKLSIKHTARVNYRMKIRQIGETTFSLARAALRARFRNNFEALVIAHEDAASPVLFDRLKQMDMHLPPAIQGRKKTDAAKAIRYADSNSLIRIETAGSSQAVSSKKGRSGTPDWVHVTEAAYIPYLDTLLQGIIGSLPPQGILTLESTSNGPRGAFYAGCLAIKTKGREIVPGQVWQWGDQVLQFTGLLAHEEYRVIGLFDGAQDEEEERLISLGATPETLLWRRVKLAEFIDDPKRSSALSPAKQFKREYPATFEEAFEESGSNFFQPKILRLERAAAELYCEEHKPVVMGLMRRNGERPEEVRATEGNRIMVYELPRDGWHGQYIVMGDVGAGNAESDPDSLYVLDRIRMRFVASAHGLMGASRHASLMVALAEYYFGAWLVWDATGIGAELRPYILASGYPADHIFHRRRNYRPDPSDRDDQDWRRDLDGFGLVWGLNREVGVSLLRHGIETRTLWTPDVDFFDEAQQFGYDANGKPCAAMGYHDDRVMSKASGVYVHDILPAPTREIQLKEFESANKVREKMSHSLMAGVRSKAKVYDGMEV